MDKKLLEVIICPRCHGKLDLTKDRSSLICRFDRLKYNIDDGLPVLLIEQAETLTQAQVDEAL
ncbi:MAG: hypothetical protein COA86_01825 [Kangiella sp.]|nr:MAG: hypothetical protein COA86_01825 [Kangiella sp.]